MSHTSRRPSTDWRAALAELDPSSARRPVTLHAAQLLLARGRPAEAEAAYRDFLERFPKHAAALEALGTLLRRTGREGEAAALYKRAFQAEIDQRNLPASERAAIEDFMLAAERFADVPSNSPPSFVAELFDRFADFFDDRLRRDLRYRAPELLFDAVARQLGERLHDLDVLDLGCGTGLAGEVFRPVARRLDGVDLSPRMIEQAAAKGVYDELATGELVAYLGAVNRYDLIVAADVFVYLGDLSPVFGSARRALRASGLLAFTVEAGQTAGYRLEPTRRFVHHRDYLMQTARDAGLEVRSLEETVTRIQLQQPVPSYLCVFAAPDAPTADFDGPLNVT